MINFIKALYHWSRIRKDKPVDRPKRLFKIVNLFGTKRYMKTRDKFLSNPDTAALLERDKTLSVLMSNYTKFKRYKKGTLGKEIYEFHELDNQYRVIFQKGCYVLQDISTGDIVRLLNDSMREAHEREITGEYSPLP